MAACALGELPAPLPRPPQLPLLPLPSSSPTLLDLLPSELISHILSFLPLQDLIYASQTCSVTYQIASSSVLSPWAGPIAVALDTVPYPDSLHRLGCYSYIPRQAFLEILVRARPQVVGGPMEMPVGLRERDWEEVMRRRFLPSWSSEDGNWRREGIKWRELYMRAINRMAHRSTTTCTTEELYTRWVTLDRRGSATLNRIRAQTFDPLDIFREIKLQNNLHHLPTTVRHVLSLTDVHILVVGVLHSPTSLFLNANAHAFLHPPLCYPDVPRVETRRPWEIAREREDKKARVAFQGRERSMSEGGESMLHPSHAPAPNGHDAVSGGGAIAFRVDSRDSGGGGGGGVGGPSTPTTSGGGGGGGGRLRKFGIPLSRTISGGGGSSTASHSSSSRQQAVDFSSSSSSPSGTGTTTTTTLASFGSSLATFLKPRSHPNSSAFSIGTHHARSRDLISSAGTLSPPSPLPFAPSAAGPTATAPPPPMPHRSLTPRSPARATRVLRPARAKESDEHPTRMPYKPMRHPQPAEGWRLYPNWTPGGSDTRRRPDGERLAGWERGGRDGRGLAGGDRAGAGWARGTGAGAGAGAVEVDGEEEGADAEDDDDENEDEDEDDWPEVEGSKRWVGPMMIIASLRTSSLSLSPHPHHSLPAPPSSSTPHPHPHPHPNGHHLLPRPGGYVSLEWDDLWSLAPWLHSPEYVGAKVGGGVGFLRNSQQAGGGGGGVM